MSALLTKAGLEAVVARCGDICFLADSTKTREGPSEGGVRVGEVASGLHLAANCACWLRIRSRVATCRSSQRRGQREWIDREDHVLMPALVTYVLSHEDERRHDFALNSEAVLRNAWRRIARIDGRHALRHHRQLRRRERRSRLPTKKRIAKRYIAETRCIRE